jgi:hypothetical protein
MASLAGSVELPAKKRTPWLPREHGFWVMLLAMALSAVARNPGWRASLMALAVVSIAVIAGGQARYQIRRDGRLQFLSALALAGGGLPIELAANGRIGVALSNFAAWSGVFVAFTFSVWACKARSSRVHRARAGTLTFFSVAAPGVAAAAFFFADLRMQAAATLLAAASSAGLGIGRPGAKQLKTVGITLAGCAGIAAALLAMA